MLVDAVLGARGVFTEDSAVTVQSQWIVQWTVDLDSGLISAQVDAGCSPADCGFSDSGLSGLDQLYSGH